MSKSCWERGEIKLPSDQAVAFRHSVVKFFNQHQTSLYGTAVSLSAQLKAAGKGKRNFDFLEAFRNLMNSQRCVEADYFVIERSIFPYDEKEHKQSRKPKTPKKQDFKLANLSAKGVNAGDEAGIGFKGSVVTWGVSENNHAVERAHEHPVAREFFRLLSQVKWRGASRMRHVEVWGSKEWVAKRRTKRGFPTLEVAMLPSKANATIMYRWTANRLCPADYATGGVWLGSCYQTADASHNIDNAFALIKSWQEA